MKNINGWSNKKIGDILDVRREKYDPKTSNEKLKYIALEHIEQRTGRLLSWGYSKETLSMKTVFHKDDILYGKLRPYLRKFCLAEYKGVCSTEILALYTKKNDLPLFSFYLLQDENIQSVIEVKTFGTKMPRTSWNELKGYNVLVPPLPEQKKIAKILSTVDNHINEVDGMIEDLKELKKGLMQKLLTEGIGHTEFKDSPVGRIPVEWEVKKLSEIASVKRGASPRPIKDPKWFDDGSSIGWVRISDVSKAKKYLYETVQFLSDEGISKSRFVGKDELIMSICASVGKPIIMKVEACIHDGFVHFENVVSYELKEYLYYFLLTQAKYYKGKGQTGTQANINSSIVGETLIPLPKREERIKIARALTQIDKQIDNYEIRYENFITLKRGLMQQLLTGKTRVKID